MSVASNARHAWSPCSVHTKVDPLEECNSDRLSYIMFLFFFFSKYTVSFRLLFAIKTSFHARGRELVDGLQSCFLVDQHFER